MQGFWATRVTTVALVTVLTVVVFTAYGLQIVNQFYGSGAYLLDAGWYAWQMTVPAILPPNPPFVAEALGEYFFAVHFMPIAPLWALGTTALGLNPIWAMASYQGATHAVLFLSGYGLASRLWGSRLAALVAGCSAGLWLAFSPVALDAIGYPHLEVTIAALFAGALTLWALYGPRQALWCLLPMLLVREDAGFHACCFFAAFALFSTIQERHLSQTARHAAIYAVGGFLFSSAAFLFQKLSFPDTDIFTDTYAGHPFFAHLTLNHILENLGRLVLAKPELVVIWLVPIVTLLFDRDWRYLAGPVAVLPWLLLNLAAVRIQPAQLFTYYAFPFLMLAVWPLFVLSLKRVSQPPKPRTIGKLTGSVVLAALCSYVLFFWVPLSDGHNGYTRSLQVPAFLPQVSKEQIDNTDELVVALEQWSVEGPRLLVDTSILALSPGAFERQNFFRFAPAEWIKEPFLLLYNQRYLESDEAGRSTYAAAATACYRLTATSIVLRGSVDAATLSDKLAPLLTAVPCRD